MMQYVTQWFRVGIDHPSRPGEYEVQPLGWADPQRVTWNERWMPAEAFVPSAAWGDKWRGLYGDPALALFERKVSDNAG